jgi:y4mF family transcriptional regulator
MTISEFVKSKRAERALTQTELAQQIGVGLRFLRELERGKESVRLDKLNQVLAFFGAKTGVIDQKTGAPMGWKQPKEKSETPPANKSKSGPQLKLSNTRKGTDTVHGKKRISKGDFLNERPHLLVLCGRNKKRSRTAEFIFKNDERFSIRSAGLSPKSNRKVNENDLRWADLVLVMEQKQRGKLTELFHQQPLPPVEVLGIPDEFEFLDLALIEMLSEKINAVWQQRFDSEKSNEPNPGS